MSREVRTLGVEIRALEPARDGGPIRFGGYAANFGILSDDLGGFREQIAPGAFTASLGADDIRCLFNHDPNYVLGRNRSGTLRLSEDDQGLLFDVDAPDAQWARDLHISVQRGDVSQCSFSFDVIRDQWWTVDGGEERTLLEVKLADVSIVTYPAYPTTAVAVRSARDVLEAHLAARREAMRRDAPCDHRRARLALKKKEIMGYEYED